MIITNFYVRLSRRDKEMLDASSMGSFKNKKTEAKWDFVEKIQRNAEYWEIDKGKESDINYEYDCIKSFVETKSVNELIVKYGFYSQILINFYKTFASHMNVPKENWNKYHEPFNDTCIDNEIVNDDCNKHDPIPENKFLYKHVNYCGVDRPCEKVDIEEEKYCKQHKHEKTSILCRDLYEFSTEVHAF